MVSKVPPTFILLKPGKIMVSKIQKGELGRTGRSSVIQSEIPWLHKIVRIH